MRYDILEYFSVYGTALSMWVTLIGKSYTTDFVVAVGSCTFIYIMNVYYRDLEKDTKRLPVIPLVFIPYCIFASVSFGKFLANFRIDFKMLLVKFKARSRPAPKHITDPLTPYIVCPLQPAVPSQGFPDDQG